MSEHKYAAILRALADGKTVQCRFNNGRGVGSLWEDFREHGFTKHAWPGVLENVEWRVKPEKKTGFIVVLKKTSMALAYPLVGSSSVFPTKEAALTAFAGMTHLVSAIVPITYEEGEGL